ncbi:MAG: ribose-phosphate diphosphokinase [Acidimicrobiia bacterium]|nr:ribose-phosphate diphosphokinase [Acidimicrobiia bacterium]
MEINSKRTLQIFAGRSNPELAQEIATQLKQPLGTVEIATFANGEIYCRFEESVRGADVYVIQTHSSPVNEAIMEQCIMIDALKRASAGRITAVCPYYGYSRQDKKARSREPIAARLVADMLSAAGAGRVISVDLHTGQIQGFFDFPFDHLTALPLLADWVRNEVRGDVVVVSPDAGRVKVTERMASMLQSDVAILYKRRSTDVRNQSETLAVVGDVEGRHCILVDDMIDTAGTICGAATLLKDHGAVEVDALATHGIFSDPAIDRLKNAPIERIVVTNTVPVSPERRFDKLTVLSAAPVVAKAIRAVFEDTSVSEIFAGNNQP